MIVVDLSHALAPDMPMYPGTEPPTLAPANTLEANGFAETSLSLYSHTGTHVDAPSHMLPGAPGLDQLDIAHFVGEACVIDVSGNGPVIEASALANRAGEIEGRSFVLFHTGWDRFWGQPRYFSGFPVLSEEAAAWLAARGLKGVGLDAISVDAVDARVFSNHLHFFRARMVLVENLRGLASLAGRRFVFSCLPLKYANADGSPVRAVAMLD